MKKEILLFVIALIGVITTSCQGKIERLYSGDYSYNTSGQMSIFATKDTIHVTHTERGSIRIVPIVNEENKVMIIRTSINGKVTRLYGTFVGDELIIKPYEYQINYAEYEGVIGNLLSTKTESVHVNCEGEVYHSGKDVTIVLIESYIGEHINAPKVMTVAEKY